MDTSARFALPLIIASQAQKHLTHNEALALLETLVQPVVQDIAALAPPADPAEADCVIVGSGAAGDFAGKDGMIAAFLADTWHFHTPQAGWLVVHAGDGAAHVFDGSTWGPLVDLAVQDNLTRIGINAAASTGNRLTVASNASLFTCESDDHRLTVNKASTSDTASLLFQSGWSGRAEMGLAGEDGFSIKVSADGAVWHEALKVDPATGHVALPQRPLAQAFLSGGSRSFPAGREAGFDGTGILQGGVALGPALDAPATGAALIVPADGVYRLGLTLQATSLGGLSVLRNGTAAVLSVEADLSSPTGRSLHASGLAALSAGDALTLSFDDAATCQCTAGATWLDLIAL